MSTTSEPLVSRLQNPMTHDAAPIALAARAYLRAEQLPCPDFVLLDLDLPKKDGREVLSEMKADPELRHLPVIIFSSSEAAQDLIHAYQLQASCFVTRAVDLEELLSSVKSISDFWLASVKLPPRTWG